MYFYLMFQKSALLFIFLISIASFAQKKDSLQLKNGIENHSLLSTHHFGIFSSRINSNFKKHPSKETTLQFSLSSGNTFQPFVEAHLPKNPIIREQLSEVIWYDRRFEFIDQITTPADYMNIVIDAVIKEFRASYTKRLSKNQELEITLRSYLITGGKYPFSFFTSDESLEWFHSNIAGGEDPFGRRYYGLNQVNFNYTDKNGKVLSLKKNDFFIGGLEINHFYYPEFLSSKRNKIFVNFGSHIGINTSKFNPSLDLGISTNALKELKLKNGNELRFAFGASLLRKNVVNFNEVVDLGNNPFLANFEAEIEYTKYTKKGNYHSFGIHYQLQTRYFKKKEASYYRLLGKWEEIHAGWQHGITTLYENLTAWSLLYTYGNSNYSFSIYLQEDLLVHNAPDIQTGISLKIPLRKN